MLSLNVGAIFVGHKFSIRYFLSPSLVLVSICTQDQD